MIRRLSGACIILVVTAQASYASSASMTFRQRPVTMAEVSNGAPSGGIVFQYFVTTDADIVSIDMVNVSLDAPLFNAAVGGSDAEPPNLSFILLFPALAADSWITTPGTTSILGGGFASPNSTWFDTANNGPRNNFQFAQLTSTGRGTFSGGINLAGVGGVERFPFNFPMLVGDFDGNETVDAADYVVWRDRNFRGADGHTAWRANFGRTLSGSSLSATIPEPSLTAMLILATLFALTVNRPADGQRAKPRSAAQLL